MQATTRFIGFPSARFLAGVAAMYTSDHQPHLQTDLTIFTRRSKADATPPNTIRNF
ncbi:MAG: hypothetical protein ICV75_08530, partial [Nitrospiraceae bacterium]|nr:hypothetical protein [Nitrospiraceae bacterium]